MRRILFGVYSAVSYGLFLITFIYLIGFTGNVGVPKSVDSGSESELAMALLVNVGLIGLFGVQHSVMARRGFKRWLLQYMPQSIERSTFVMATNMVLVVLYVLWQPIRATVWNVQFGAGQVVLYTLFGAGWSLSVLASFLINHFELFGLQQGYFILRGRPMPTAHFRLPLLYKVVRHPLQLGMMMGLWAIPHMTAGHLLFAVSMTIYILIGLYFEERDLVREFGEEYEAYRRRTPKLVPALNRMKDGDALPRTAALSTREMVIFISALNFRR